MTSTHRRRIRRPACSLRRRPRTPPAGERSRKQHGRGQCHVKGCIGTVLTLLTRRFQGSERLPPGEVSQRRGRATMSSEPYTSVLYRARRAIRVGQRCRSQHRRADGRGAEGVDLGHARTEGYNRLVKQVKRAACGFRNPANSARRIRFHCTRKQRAATQTSC